MLTNVLFARHLDDDETLVDVVHRHWLLGWKALWLPTLVFVGVWFALAFGVNRYMLTIVGVAELCIAVWWLRSFFDYYLDAWIITDQGIIDVSWHGWFHRQSSRILYSDIHGVSYEIQGIASTLLRFGTVSIEKVSGGTVVSLEDVASPRRVENLILKNMEEYMHTKNLKDAKTVQTILSEFVASSVQLKDGKIVGAKETGGADVKKKSDTVSGTRRW